MERTTCTITTCTLNERAMKLHYSTKRNIGFSKVYFFDHEFTIEDLVLRTIMHYEYQHFNEIEIDGYTNVKVYYNDGSEDIIEEADMIVIKKEKGIISIRKTDDRFGTNWVDLPLKAVDIMEQTTERSYRTYGDGTDLLRWRNRDLY